MNWTDRLLDLLEAKAVLKQDDSGAAAARRQAAANKAARRAANRAQGTTLPTLRTATGDSSEKRKAAERDDSRPVFVPPTRTTSAGTTRPPTPEEQQVISGKRPSKNQPHNVSNLRKHQREREERFKANVVKGEEDRARLAASTTDTPQRNLRAQGDLKARLQAKFRTRR